MSELESFAYKLVGDGYGDGDGYGNSKGDGDGDGNSKGYGDGY